MKKVMNLLKKHSKLILLVVLAIVLIVVVCIMKKKSIQPVKKEEESSKKQLVFFHMNGCGHCESMKPEWKKLTDMGEYKGVKFLDIENNENRELLKKHEIRGFPTIKLCKNGVEDVKNCVTHQGERSAEALKKMIDQH